MAGILTRPAGRWPGVRVASLLPGRAVAAEREDLLDPARAVREPDRGRQDARQELDPLRVGVRLPRGRVLAALCRCELGSGRVHGGPQRRATRCDVAVAAEARLERALERGAGQLPEVLVHLVDAASCVAAAD